MSNVLKNTLIFAAGAAIGSVITYRYLNDKYVEIVKEEVDSVKETFNKKLEKVKTEYDNEEIITIRPGEKQDLKDLSLYANNEEIITAQPSKKPDLKGLYDDILKDKEYRDYSEYADPRKEVRDISDLKTRPYVISPEVFGDEYDYDLYVYTYYADGVVTDEGDEPIEKEELDELIGLDSLNTFGQYEEDAIYVRNEGLKIDYEILKDNSNYADRAQEVD